MKEFRFKLIIIIAAIALSVYLLYPTYLDYQNNKDIKQTIETDREQLIKSNQDLTKTQIYKMKKNHIPDFFYQTIGAKD